MHHRPLLNPRWKTCALLAALITGAMPGAVQSSKADEHLFGWVRGAETLPQGHFDAYQFFTLRTGKPDGTYYGGDFDTEVEYGFTDRFQMGVAVVNHYFNYRGVEELDDFSGYRFGGAELSAKYRVLSPFKDLVGLTFRVEGGYLRYDDVGGLDEQEWYVAPEVILHKNFFDDTLIFQFNAGVEWAWGKQPAEQYPREFSVQGGLGVSYRFARNWFFGVEGHVRSEYPLFDLGNFEHAALYAGPSLHYGAEKWWATLSWNYQFWGNGVDEEFRSQTFAEETRQQFRLKVGFNF